MIFNIQRFSLHDGDGIRTVVFFKGCPLRCRWCSNPESQAFSPELQFDSPKCIGCGDCAAAAVNGEVEWRAGPVVNHDVIPDAGAMRRVCPAEALTVSGEDKTAAAILAEVEKDRVFYRGKGGVTLSGGEPFAQPELAERVLRAAKQAGLSTSVETCLATPWRAIEQSLPHLDSVYADVKHVDADKYREATRGDLAQATDNLRRLAACGVPVAARVPVIPGFNDAPKELGAIAGFVADLKTIRKIHLLPYHNYGAGKYGLLGRDYAMAGTPSTPPEALEGAAAAMRKTGLEIVIGG